MMKNRVLIEVKGKDAARIRLSYIFVKFPREVWMEAEEELIVGVRVPKGFKEELTKYYRAGNVSVDTQGEFETILFSDLVRGGIGVLAKDTHYLLRKLKSEGYETTQKEVDEKIESLTF